MYRRHKTVGDVSEKKAFDALNELGLTFDEAEAIYHLTSLPKFDERFVIPASHREQALEMLEHTGDTKGKIGFGANESVQRGL
jgi:nitrate reductase beta subunit